eukprot:scaffold15267_cov118-Isochrysis_galbana.AAC.8
MDIAQRPRTEHGREGRDESAACPFVLPLLTLPAAPPQAQAPALKSAATSPIWYPIGAQA